MTLPIERYELTIVPADDSARVGRDRLRWLLETALRCFRTRSIALREIEPDLPRTTEVSP
ncbi:MAG TPA: hypothetical protein VM165_09005 [Planctomycetaceae bacterium]|nr:hypothetical protein [Planctomycetaceae bacterium]